MTISPEALEKARAIVADWQGRHDVVLPIAAFRELVAALQAAPKLPDDLAGLVERLEEPGAVCWSDVTDARTTIQSLVARNAELEAGLRGLLDCPDIADNDYKDEETHAAERVARSLLNKDHQP